jgi:hypothetical protein
MVGFDVILTIYTNIFVAEVDRLDQRYDTGRGGLGIRLLNSPRLIWVWLFAAKPRLTW